MRLSVAASGNESMREQNKEFVVDVSVPAAANEDILSVGAVMDSMDGLRVANFSNTNPRICAPGVDVWSASLENRLRLDSGTSMAMSSCSWCCSIVVGMDCKQ